LSDLDINTDFLLLATIGFFVGEKYPKFLTSGDFKTFSGFLFPTQIEFREFLCLLTKRADYYSLKPYVGLVYREFFTIFPFLR
jgi:hypothetical protein